MSKNKKLNKKAIHVQIDWSNNNQNCQKQKYYNKKGAIINFKKSINVIKYQQQLEKNREIQKNEDYKLLFVYLFIYVVFVDWEGGG